MHKGSEYVDYWKAALDSFPLNWLLFKEKKDIEGLIYLIHKSFDLDIFKVEHFALQCKQSNHTRAPFIELNMHHQNQVAYCEF